MRPLGPAPVLFLALTLAAGCGGGSTPSTITCQAGTVLCGGSCINASTNTNCGACGNVCTGTTSCQPNGDSFACKASCASFLDAPYDNAETGTWDGNDRTAAAVSFDQARNNCASFGGRLPTATELARLSRDTGAPHKTSALWSLTADGTTRRFTVNIATGTAAPLLAASTAAYRCLCPAPAPAAFSGNACFGPPGTDQCVTPGNGPQAWDATDRLALTKAGAIWECDRVGGHLPTAAQYAEAISLTPKLAGGTNQWLHTGDDQSYDRDGLVRFGTAYEVTQSFSSDLRPFRCMGLTSAAALPAAPLSASVHLAERGGMQADLSDAATSRTYGDAVSACWNAGGHLPTATELASLVASGLSNGSGTPILTADTIFPNGTWFTATYRWSGGPTVPGYEPGATSWVWYVSKADTATYPYRCVYYPVDATYTGPAPADCQGGCSSFSKTMPGGTLTSKSWIDLEDRTAAVFTAAAATCAGLGGQLPSMRDYTELIRAGLAGTSTNLWTADLVYYNNGPGGPYVVNWTGGSNGTFTGATGGGVVGIGTATKFRCLWTNERR